MTHILIADDHAILRRGLKEILMGELEGVVFHEAGSAQDVLDQIQTIACDLVILDITMPGRSGLDLLRDLQQLRPELPVLVAGGRYVSADLAEKLAADLSANDARLPHEAFRS